MANAIKVIRQRDFVLVSRTRYTLEFVKQQRSEENVILKCLTSDDLHGVLLALLHGVG
jgi:hypothetical protein